MATMVSETIQIEKLAEEVALGLPEKGVIVAEDTPYTRAIRAMDKEIAPILAEAKKVTKIETSEEAEKATQFGRLLHVANTERAGFFKKIKQTIDALKAPVLEQEKKTCNPLVEEKDRLGRLQSAYDEKVRREKEEADRKAREEQLRIAQEEQLLRAIELESEGDVDQAEAVLEEKPILPAITTQFQSTPKIAGKVGRVNYSATVDNLMELVKAVASGKAPIQAIEANMTFINGQARLMKEGFDMPGCKLNEDRKTHYRG